MATMSATAQRGSAGLARSIMVAGLVIAVLNGLDQTIFAVLALQATPLTVFQYFASAVLGLAAFSGGYATALLGLLMHLVIAFVVTGVFILAARSMALVRRTVFVSAPIYGAAVSFISSLILPFTAAPKLPVTTLVVAHSLIADALFIGLPLAMAVWLGGRARGV